MSENKTIHEPLFHISKRNIVSRKTQVLVYVIAIVVAMVFISLLCFALLKANPIKVIVEIFNGNFGTTKRKWLLFQDMSLLLLVGLALVPSFKMKFWNLGGNGQILISCLVCIACMKFLGGKISDPLVWIIMLISCFLAGAIWAVIPAIFKAFFNTNESLFTLMMNYIASGLVVFFEGKWADTSAGTINPINKANLPKIFNNYVLVIIFAVIVTAFMYFYLKKSKHGFEVGLVGESQNTAKYVGLSVKKVFIRTLILSGGICGIVGLLLGGAVNHTVNSNTANNMGFTAIMVVWFAKCDPLLMIISSFGIIFLTKGMYQVKTVFGLYNNAVADLVVGLAYFIIIACEFFIIYKINLKKKNKATLTDISQKNVKKEDK